MRVFRLLVRTIAAAVCLCVATPSAAQYFGRNKVEYENFEFQILATDHFDIYYYPQEERAVRVAARLAERWYARLSAIFNHEFDRRQPLVLYGSQAQFSQTNVVSGILSDSIGGVTEGSRRRIAMPFAPTLAETDRVLGHELVHAFQFDLARRYGSDAAQPLWFIEGMAEYVSRGRLEGDALMWIRDAVLSERLPANLGAASRQLSPYLFGHAFWSYLGERFGDEVVEKALKPGRKQRRLKDRMQHATGMELQALYAEWRAAAYRRYENGREGRDRLTFWNRDFMQIGPSLSPDGSQAVFFSERDRMSLDLFLADVASGRVIRKLATTAASTRFDSLQPLRSTGTWSPDGRQFAFAAVRNGQARLIVIDIQTGKTNREYLFSGLGQVLAPAWSPDGRSIAFSAIANGATDLYVANVATGSLCQLTDDVFADLQPAWSRDGKRLAFVTESIGSDAASLSIRRPQLALLDMADGSVAPLNVGGTLQLSPQWSEDDRELYYVGDVDGITNVMRVNLQSKLVSRITDVPTAVTGITPTGPALSLSADASTLAFTIYRHGLPRLVVFDEEEIAASVRPIGETASLQEVLTDAVPSRIGELLADYSTGLAGADSMQTREYKPTLSLDGIGQPYLSSGGGPFGTFVRGGGGLMFGDMLGERRLGATVQIGNRARDAAFALRFLNQERRWTWGAVAELEPGIARFRSASAVDHGGESALLKQTDYLQRMQLRTAALVAYPFSRGLRLELYAGVRHARYWRDHRAQVSSLATGKVLDSSETASAAGAPTTVGEAGAALVRDTTVFGPTGPLMGSRYRLEITPAAGHLSYTHVLADVRRYVMPVRPFTVAMRMVHSARYGGDATDTRLMPNYLGSYFVRGHRGDLRFCHPEEARSCGDELLGQRLLAGNLEIRFPLWGLLARQLDYGPLPIDAFLFADGGRIVMGAERATAISSLGAGLRISALGLPFEIGAVRALDGPRPRWQFDFGFRAGF